MTKQGLRIQEEVGVEVTRPDTMVIYHANCMDGFCAAYMMKKVYPDAAFLAQNYDDPVPDVRDKNLIIVDFSYKRDALEKLNVNNKSLLVLDHHKTARKELEGLSYCIFDMEKSGARLVTDYYNLPSNWLVDYTEDRDLWRFHLHESKAINAALRQERMDFGHWVGLESIDPNTLVLKGHVILATEREVIANRVQYAQEVTILGHKVLWVNCTSLISETGNQLCMDRPFSITSFSKDFNETFIFSLRSNSQGVDVSEIAKTFGGGGHQHAAGFSLKRSELERLIG